MKAKRIIGAGIALVGALASIRLFGKRAPQKYSDKWFDTVSDAVLNTERETVRKQFVSSGRDMAKAIDLQNLLRRFDDVLSKRAWGNEIPHPPRIHREHGLNLFKKD